MDEIKQHHNKRLNRKPRGVVLVAGATRMIGEFTRQYYESATSLYKRFSHPRQPVRWFKVIA